VLEVVADVLRFVCFGGQSLLVGYTVVVAGPNASPRRVPPDAVAGPRRVRQLLGGTPTHSANIQSFG